jgi:hypothetical protein
MAAVISSGSCRARYSFSASLNNWLRDFFMYRASLSAPSKTSAGIEIAVLTQLLCHYRLPDATQSKFPASSMLPVPLYLATSG